LDTSFRLGSTENTKTDPEIKAAIVPQTLRVKREEAVKIKQYTCKWQPWCNRQACSDIINDEHVYPGKHQDRNIPESVTLN
jgi:hypothetical protein